MRINNYIIKSIRDMLSLETIKLALYTGVPLALFWIAVGWLLWDPITAFTIKVISWIPFSVVRANGAFIIIFYLWFAAVLISYALFVGLFSGLLLAQKEESRFEAINFGTIFVFAIFWAVVIFASWPALNERIQYYLTLLPFQTVAEGIAWLLAIHILYNLFLISEYFVVFLFREPFIAALLEKHYPDFETKEANLKARAFGRLTRDTLLYLLLFVLILPVLFIPVANFLATWFLWAWLYKESAFLGVCSLLCDERLYDDLREHKGTLFVISLLAALLNFIPIISFFTPFFVFTLYFHWIMEERAKLAA